MSKANKHKPKGIDNLKGMTTETLEQRAKADLSQQNYRRAKEWLKELCKRNTEQYLPELIRCYQELARQMLEKGQRGEAKTVFDRIRSLGGETAIVGAEAPSTISPDGDPAAAALVASRHDEGAPLPPAESRAMADAMVLTYPDHPAPKEVNPAWQGELTAIGMALEYVCAERFADAVRELKQIGLQSVFSGWRLFIKGLCAFYTGDDSRARESFVRLGSEPLLSKAARPFLFIIGEPGASPSPGEAKEPLLTQVCTVLNRRELEHVLPRAEFLWGSRRYGDSYEHMAKTLTGFPSEDPGLLRTLSRFYFNAVFAMHDGQTEKYIKSIHYMASKKKKNAVDALLFARMINLHCETDEMIPPHEITEMWEEFLFCHQRVHGENAKLRALVYAHLGDIFSREEEDDPFEHIFKRKMQKGAIRNARLAQAAYEKSLGLNSADKEVHLSVLRLYERTGEAGKRNKKLDEISRLFPDDKETLIKNGHYCIERKSFLKGLDYLKRAARLDPLDRQLREGLGVAYIMAARYFAGKRDARRYREFMGEAIGMGEKGLANITLGRPYLQVRLALFEWIGGCEQEGDILLNNALNNGNDASRLMFFAYLAARIYGAPAHFCSQLEKRVQNEFKNPTPALAAAFADIIQYINRIDLPQYWIGKEFDRLNRYALEAAKKPCSPQEAEQIIQYALRQGHRGKKLVRKYIRIILDQDPRNPLFLYFQYIDEKDDNLRRPTAADQRRLEEMLVIAVERNERLLINLLNKDIRAIADYLSMDDALDAYAYEDGDEDGESDLKDIFENVMKEFKPKRRSSARKNKAETDQQQGTLFDDIPF